MDILSVGIEKQFKSTGMLYKVDVHVDESGSILLGASLDDQKGGKFNVQHVWTDYESLKKLVKLVGKARKNIKDQSFVRNCDQLERDYRPTSLVVEADMFGVTEGEA